MDFGAGVALGRVMAQQLSQGLLNPEAAVPAVSGVAPVALRPDEVMATTEKLADLTAKGMLTDEEFSAKKAELLKKLV